jgi:3-oxoacyl-[acyl-carrier protein] reductase
MSSATQDQAPSGRVALVTGASRGIGAATAVALARRGIAPVLAVRSAAAAEATARAVRELGEPCRIEVCDVADHAAVRRSVENTLQAWGRLDIVVNNAAQIDPIGHLADTDPAEWARAFAVNVVGAYHVIHAALPALMAGGAGAVINLSSGAAHAPREGWSAYCSTKAALFMLTRSVANEYGDQGIAAFGVQPGLVDTDMQGRIRKSGINEISRVPREQLAPPERSAALIAWLAAERPADLRGQDLSANNAELMQRAASAVAQRA